MPGFATVIGLTGGIGAGKSTVAQVLGEFGARIVDVDQIGHSVYEPGTEGWDRVVREFGRDVVAADGTIDRKRLGQIVFADPRRLVCLNQLLHPLMGAVIRQRIAAGRGAGDQTPIVVEAAVMIEASWQSMVDELWVVVASREAILARVAEQRGLSKETIEARVNAQMSDKERCQYADVVIDNSGTTEELRDRLRQLWVTRVVRGEA